MHAKTDVICKRCRAPRFFSLITPILLQMLVKFN